MVKTSNMSPSTKKVRMNALSSSSARVLVVQTRMSSLRKAVGEDVDTMLMRRQEILTLAQKLSSARSSAKVVGRTKDGRDIKLVDVPDEFEDQPSDNLNNLI